MFAAGERHRRIDVLGVVVIGLAVSLGGSLLRDIVLNQPPVVLWTNWYMLVVGASAILGMALQAPWRGSTG
ncbi:TRIC cation channel family protein [Lentzea sp. NPDC051208]|uniref:TRIC cation channel family protein n=1 Tax=Lentzea sp. NPDC051208 TaxID=3154642 RepID=UPI003435479F